MTLKSETTVLLVTLAASTLGICMWQWRKRRKVFVKVGTVKALYHFPIKSLAAVEVSELECTSYGAVSNGLLDRAFMLATEKGVLISQRDEPSMVLLKAKVYKEHVMVSGGGKDPLKIQISDVVSPEEKVVTAIIHGDRIPAVDCGDEAAEWFQDFLKRQDVRLLRYAQDISDRKKPNNDPYMNKLLGEPFTIYLHDESPFHVITQSSVDEVNSKCEAKVSCLNFRPNVVVEGCQAYEEDNWKYLSFSSGAEIVTKMPCGRCVLTTNDPETGIKTNKEPLTVLRKFRMLKDEKLSKSMHHEPCFGIKCSLEKPGHIRVGDDVYAVICKGLFQYKDAI